MSDREERQAEMEAAIREVCPPYITFYLDEWNKTDVVESWSLNLSFMNQRLGAVPIGFSTKLGRIWLSHDAAELTREEFDHNIRHLAEDKYPCPEPKVPVEPRIKKLTIKEENAKKKKMPRTFWIKPFIEYMYPDLNKELKQDAMEYLLSKDYGTEEWCTEPDHANWLGRHNKDIVKDLRDWVNLINKGQETPGNAALKVRQKQRKADEDFKTRQGMFH
jgi:hypothetical protein